MCQSLHAEAPGAIVSEGLAQGPYAAASVGIEPVMLQLLVDWNLRCPALKLRTPVHTIAVNGCCSYLGC